MGTVLVYRNDGERPTCEVALDDGDRVQLKIDKTGLLIERQAVGAAPAEVLFKGDAEAVTDMCMALLGSTPASRKTALELLASVVTQLPTAAHVREAFNAAAKAV